MALLGIELHCQTVAQERSWLISSCKMRQSAELVIVWVQDAIISKQLYISDWMLLVMSIMYRGKRRGPETVPCGRYRKPGGLRTIDSLFAIL